MSVETNVHVGPVIKCKGPTKFVNHEGRRCPNKECSNHTDGHMHMQFCSECGAKIETYDIPYPMSHFDILDSEGVDENTFYVMGDGNHNVGEDIEILTDNQRSDHTKSFSNFGGDDSMVMDDDTVLHALQYFKSKFAKELAILEKYYESVTVDYMVFMYYT